jgi:hypothetical protein
MSIKTKMTLKRNRIAKDSKHHRNDNRGDAQPRTHRQKIPVHLHLLSSSFEHQRENSKVEYTYGWYSTSA